MRPLLLAIAVLAAVSSASSLAKQLQPEILPVLPPPPIVLADQPAQASALDRIFAGDWRSAANKERDKYRHPRQTLEFFGVLPGQRVIEIWPGAAGMPKCWRHCLPGTAVKPA